MKFWNNLTCLGQHELCSAQIKLMIGGHLNDKFILTSCNYCSLRLLISQTQHFMQITLEISSRLGGTSIIRSN